MPTPSNLDDLARPHAGVVSRRLLREAGWSPSQIDRAVNLGALHRLGRGVYRTAGAPVSRSAARHAAILLLGHDAVIAGRSAAELHGFADPRPGPIEVLVPHHLRAPEHARELVRVRRTRSLPQAHRTDVDGLGVTTPPRTLLDLAARMSRDRVLESTAAALRSGVTTAAEIDALLTARPRVAGRGRLRQALAVLEGDGALARSGVEVVALDALIAGGLPRPVVAHRVHDAAGRLLAEVDLAYPAHRLAIEIDGYRWHSSPAAKRADEARQNHLVMAGWTVLRFSAGDVRHRPHELVATVRATLATLPLVG